MKTFKLLTISLLAALTAFGGTYAYAAESGTIYPEDKDFIKSLNFTSLTDYAVNGEIYAFAENETVSVFDSGALTVYSFGQAVTALDCTDGKFYCLTESEDVFTLPYEEGQAPVKYDMPAESDTVLLNDYTYRLASDGVLKIADFKTDNVFTADGIFEKLKCFDEKAYAISGNCLYGFNGEQAEKITLEYADYTATTDIVIGNTAEALKNYSLKFVSIENGSYMTEIDLTSLDGEHFISGTTITAKADTTALLLCYTSGNAAVVAIGDSSYILLKSKTREVNVTCESAPEFNNATITGNTIYASPYVIIGTAAQPEAAGTIVKVNKKLQYENVLGSAFYEVEYTTADGKRTGYVAEGFLTEYIIEDNKQPNEFPDPDYSEKNDVKTVLLIFAVVVLVLTAVGYLAYVGTSGKRSKSNKKYKSDPNEEK